MIGDPARRIRTLAWCSGGAQGYFAEAVSLGVDAYLTGEASEHNVHLARESGVAFIGAGHHATERYGVQALGEEGHPALDLLLGVEGLRDLEFPGDLLLQGDVRRLAHVCSSVRSTTVCRTHPTERPPVTGPVRRRSQGSSWPLTAPAVSTSGVDGTRGVSP